jgi:hypothetical protein
MRRNIFQMGFFRVASVKQIILDSLRCTNFLCATTDMTIASQVRSRFFLGNAGRTYFLLKAEIEVAMVIWLKLDESLMREQAFKTERN